MLSSVNWIGKKKKRECIKITKRWYASRQEEEEREETAEYNDYGNPLCYLLAFFHSNSNSARFRKTWVQKAESESKEKV